MCSSESDWVLSPSLSVDGDFSCFIVSHAAFCLQLLPSFHPLFILDKCRRIPILWCDSPRNWLLWRWTPSVCLEFWNPVDQVVMLKWSLAPCPGSGDKIPRFCLLLSTQTLPSSANIQAHTHTRPHAHTRTHAFKWHLPRSHLHTLTQQSLESCTDSSARSETLLSQHLYAKSNHTDSEVVI